jgi:probable H4MPT-linked C1 transfer pathway protein
MRMDDVILGWDVGGVNTKVAQVTGGDVRSVLARPFEIQRSPDRLAALLRELSEQAGAANAAVHAVTMTAELSQMFRTKREGVSFVLDAFDEAFPGAEIHVYTVTGQFVSPRRARERPLDVAAANWSATAHVVARPHPNALLIDVGTTTTDLIPIVDGRVVAAGLTDPERLASGELVYTGAVRTPVEAVVREVPLGDSLAGVSAEGFALTGDVHIWRGDLSPTDYDAPTPDGRPPTREFAGERLARVVCADREMVDADGIRRIADAVAAAQVETIATAIRRLRARHDAIDLAVVTGLGAFIGAAAGRAAGMQVAPFSSHVGDAGAHSAPATAVALLLASGRPEGQPLHREVTSESVEADLQVGPNIGLTVLKLGGSLLADRDQWHLAIAAIAHRALTDRLVVVPGGGPFADAVRDVDARFGLSDDAAHWMAVAAMDQHAEMIAAALPAASLVRNPADVRQALRSGRPAVLAPLGWMRAVDPLPHSWDVTSDSIAAWVAGALGARRLLLIKPAGASGSSAVDRYFARALPPGLEWSIQPVHELASR